MFKLTTYLLLAVCAATATATASASTSTSTSTSAASSTAVATATCDVPFGFIDDHNVTERFWCNEPTGGSPSTPATDGTQPTQATNAVNATNATPPTQATQATRRLADGGLPIPDVAGIISSGVNAYNMIKNYVNPDSQNCEVVTSLLPDNHVCDWYWNAAINQYVCRDKWQTKMKFAFESNTGKRSEFWVNSENANSPTDSFYQGRTRSGNLGTGEGLRSVSFSFRGSSCLKYVAISCGNGISAANEANLLIGVNWIYEKLWREGKTNMARCGPFNQGQNFPGLDYVLGLTISGAAFACGGDYNCILANTNLYSFPSNQWN